jgi:hypothetical protein
MRCCARDEGFGPSEPPCGGGSKPLRSTIGMVPPVEYGQAHYAALKHEKQPA